jgi:hypothetical protein
MSGGSEPLIYCAAVVHDARVALAAPSHYPLDAYVPDFCGAGQAGTFMLTRTDGGRVHGYFAPAGSVIGRLLEV